MIEFYRGVRLLGHLFYWPAFLAFCFAILLSNNYAREPNTVRLCIALMTAATCVSAFWAAFGPYSYRFRLGLFGLFSVALVGVSVFFIFATPPRYPFNRWVVVQSITAFAFLMFTVSHGAFFAFRYLWNWKLAHKNESLRFEPKHGLRHLFILQGLFCISLICIFNALANQATYDAEFGWPAASEESVRQAYVHDWVNSQVPVVCSVVGISGCIAISMFHLGYLIFSSLPMRARLVHGLIQVLIQTTFLVLLKVIEENVEGLLVPLFWWYAGHCLFTSASFTFSRSRGFVLARSKSDSA